MTTILFLDIDGVLNTVNSCKLIDSFGPGFDQECVNNLNKLCEQTPNLKIVISSTWRKGRTIKELQTLFASRNFKYPYLIVDKTPNHTTKSYEKYVLRGDEIHDWIKTNYPYQHINYVIVDDDSDMLEYQKSRFVQTDFINGFDKKALDLTVNLFSYANLTNIH